MSMKTAYAPAYPKSNKGLNRGSDRFVEDLECDVDVFFREYQRWRPADRFRSGAEDDQTTFETGDLNAIAQLHCRKLDPEHHAKPAHIHNAIVLLLKLDQSCFQVRSNLFSVLHKPAFKQLDRLQRCRNAHRIPTKRRRVC